MLVAISARTDKFARGSQDRLGILALLALSAPFRILWSFEKRGIQTIKALNLKTDALCTFVPRTLAIVWMWTTAKLWQREWCRQGSNPHKVALGRILSFLRIP
jgi:hypothetical protein